MTGPRILNNELKMGEFLFVTFALAIVRAPD